VEEKKHGGIGKNTFIKSGISVWQNKGIREGLVTGRGFSSEAEKGR